LKRRSQTAIASLPKKTPAHRRNFQLSTQFSHNPFSHYNKSSKHKPTMPLKRKAQEPHPMESPTKREKLTSTIYGWLSSTVGSLFTYLKPETGEPFSVKERMPGSWPESPEAPRRIKSLRSPRLPIPPATREELRVFQGIHAQRVPAHESPLHESPLHQDPLHEDSLNEDPLLNDPLLGDPLLEGLVDEGPDEEMIDASTHRPEKTQKKVHWPGHDWTGNRPRSVITKEVLYTERNERYFRKDEPTLKIASYKTWRSPERYDPDESILSPDASKANAYLDASPVKSKTTILDASPTQSTSSSVYDSDYDYDYDSEHDDPNNVEISDILQFWMHCNAQTTKAADLKVSESIKKNIRAREATEREKRAKKRKEKLKRAEETRLAQAKHARKNSAELKVQREEELRLTQERLEAADAARRAAEEAEAEKLAEEAAYTARLVAARQELEQIYADMQARARRSIKLDLSAEWEQKIEAAMATRENFSVLVKRNGVTRHDFGTLLPQRGRDSASGWLNDQIVNTTMEMMVGRINEQIGHDMTSKTDPAPYWAFNSAWLKTITNGVTEHWQNSMEPFDSKHPGLLKFSRWAKKKGVNLGGANLLQAQKIYFPICHQSHWTMIVVYPQNKKIEFLNSFSGSGKEYTFLVRAWLALELGEDFHDDDWEDVRNRSPPQRNGQDCGVFALMNAFATIRDKNPSSQFDLNDIPALRRQVAATLLNGGFNGEFDFWGGVKPPQIAKRIAEIVDEFPQIYDIELLKNPDDSDEEE
jgi:sentrin-specific protease 1